MRFKLFLTEAERQRVRTRVILRFFGLMLIIALAFAAILMGRYVLGWW
jgi:hypothetical protein